MYKVLPLRQAEPNALGAAPPEEVFNDWLDFKSPKGGFHAFLPVFPQNAKENVTDPRTKEVRKYDMYIAEKGDGTIFMVSLITLPKVPEKGEEQKYLQGLIDNMLAGNESNKLVDSKITTFKTYPAIDFAIDNQDLAIKGIVFIKKDLLAILTRVSKIANRNNNEFTFFSNSFNFNPPKEEN